MRPICPSYRQTMRRRGGAAIVEAAIVLPVAMTGLFVMLDLGLAVAQSNSLSDSARHAARLAIVHGADSSDPLGPSDWNGTVDDDHVLAAAVRPRLLAMSPEDVTMSVSWPDGSNETGRAVQINLRFRHPPLLVDFLGRIELTGRSTMRILR